MGNFLNAIPVNISFQDHDLFKKFACVFAGLGHMQPLLLATTNSHYLLDRFCMERCCSGEYVSRIVTSLIFMEILATLIIAPAGVGIGLGKFKSSLSGQDLNNWNEHKEEPWRGRISTAILTLIFLCYFQIFYAFTTGGKKGHMHWFYVSLMIQQFVCLLIGGAIGFWEGGVTLWYLMAIPMGPIPVFFYQLMIHSWIRNNGPRYPEYLVVEWQIGLVICLSCIATLLWIYAYCQPYYPIELEIKDLNTGSLPSTDDGDRIATGNAITLALSTTGTVQYGQVPLSTIGLADVNVTASVTLTGYSVTLTTAKLSGSKYVVNLTAKAELKIEFSGSGASVKVKSAIRTEEPKINLITTGSSTFSITIKRVTPDVNVNKKADKSVEISLAIEEIRVTLESSQTIESVTATIPVAIKVTASSEPTEPVPIDSIKLTLPAKKSDGSTTTGNVNLTLSPPPAVNSGKTLNVTVEAAQTGGSNAVQAVGHGFYPKKDYYCFYSVRDSTGNKDIWADIGGKCAFAACYKKRTGAGALLCLYLSNGGGPLERKYFGKGNDGQWKTISETQFIQKLPALAKGSLSNLTGQETDQYNRIFKEVLGPPSKPTPTWFPLVMHGMAVGSFGSIFPNLIPKTLTCPRTTRTLTVVSIFLSPLPGIFNVMFADNGWPSAACAWTEGSGIGWLLSYSLYIFYGLAFLFAIFNVHSPEWKLCCYIRSHGWMPFMMTLSITLIIEILIAIARAGIMTQRSAKNDSEQGKLNHPLLWNKMACLMSLSYIPFWMTTTPMMKSYVSSLDPFLCDKDRDHWPTARYGAWRSGWYWCKCACRGLYNSPRKLVTLNMRKALTRKDPKVYFLVTHDLPPED